jgi:hypothetical protein
VLSDADLDKMAEKVADILTARFEKRQQEIAKDMMAWLWDTPFPSIDEHIEALRGKTTREALDDLKE